MPFTDAVSNVSGRNSRASNVSGITASTRSQSRPNPPADTLASAGVLSMLKTSTDTGDIGSLPFNTGRLPNMHKQAHRKKGGHHGRKLSGGSLPPGPPSLHYTPSQVSKVSSNREWDSNSNRGRGSFTSMQSVPPSLPPMQSARGAFGGPPQSSDPARDMRSQSMTSTLATQSLPRYRSQTSLKNQNHGLRPNPQQRPPPPNGPPYCVLPENRPQYAYPSRLKRPGYRAASPALSDTYAVPGSLPPGPTGPPGQYEHHGVNGTAPGSSGHPPVQHPPGARRMQMGAGLRPPPRVYNGEYAADYPTPPPGSMRPPPRLMSSSPGPNMEYADTAHYPYQNPMAARSAPGIAVLNQPAPRPMPPQQCMMQQRSQYPQQLAPGMLPPHRGAPAGYPHGQRIPPNLMRELHHSQQGSRVPPPPPAPEVAPMVHHIFHNAARMSRHLPKRTETPMTDLSPPSSDPPSSGTAPTSSNPPTPRDMMTSQVVIDPALINPALVDLPDSTSEPVLPHQYLQYADALEKELDEQEVVAAHPSVPPFGFVQRVRAMLESKGISEPAAKKSDPESHLINGAAELDAGEHRAQVHELAANNTPQATLLDEGEDPVELPASPVANIAELAGTSVPPRRRITREMVKTELGPSDSVENTTSVHIEPGDSTNIDMIIEHMRNFSREEALARAEEAGHDEQPDLEPALPEAHHDPAGKMNSQQPKQRVSEDADDLPENEDEDTTASGVDHATNFSNETQSRDPFLLDADTLTLQRQKNKKQSVSAITIRKDLLDVTNSDIHPVTRDAVSPLRFGERVVRDSAVSPLQTQTLGIDETIYADTEATGLDTTCSSKETTTPVKERAMPGTFPEEGFQVTPRKTYSKSVQLQPRTNLSNAPASNRASLPPDFSTIADSTIDTTSSDMVTDVAFRFSLPQTTITVSKPQIIEIPASSSPEQPSESLPGPGVQPAASKTRRNSVRFDDEVTPLKITKKPENQAPIGGPSEKQALNDASISPRPSTLQSTLDNPRLSHESTTDLRFSGTNAGFNKFGSTHLPGLKEESTEDMSVHDKRATLSDIDLEFPLPARIAAVKAMQERRLHEAGDKARARRANRHRPRPLADTRDLPSLNFSRMDLIDKLNEALEVRSSRSMDVVRGRDISGIYCPSPQRPQSTEPLRERYTSFFSKPEDFANFLDDLQDETNDTGTESNTDDGQPQGRTPPQQPAVPVVEIEPNTEVETLDGPERGLSPEDFLHVATQVNRLSIPSVSGLSERLSELLPNLRDLQLDSILAGFAEHDLDLRRPETVLSNRTSAGFRTLAERAEEIVKNGTHDSTQRKDLPSLRASLADGKPSAYLSGSISAPSNLGRESSRPASALSRRRAPTNADEVRELLPPEMNPIIRDPRRAIVSTRSSRPWNQDENYPWSSTIIDVDLSVPSRNSAMSEIGQLRRTKSLDLTSSAFRTKGKDIGSIIDHDQSDSLTLEKLTGVSQDTKHKHSKLSVIGSITRKIGFTCTNTDSMVVPGTVPAPTAVRSDCGSPRAHRPGERYPTSGLIQPSAFTLDEVRSFFSDESSDEKQRHGSLRKRLTQLKAKGRSVRLETSRCQSRSRSLDATTAYDAGSSAADLMDRFGGPTPDHTNDGFGMSRTEFHFKRFGEKLRHLVAKGSQLLRSWSQRSRGANMRSEHAREDWLSDSLYSGV